MFHNSVFFPINTKYYPSTATVSPLDNRGNKGSKIVWSINVGFIFAVLAKSSLFLKISPMWTKMVGSTTLSPLWQAWLGLYSNGMQEQHGQQFKEEPATCDQVGKKVAPFFEEEGGYLWQHSLSCQSVLKHSELIWKKDVEPEPITITQRMILEALVLNVSMNFFLKLTSQFTAFSPIFQVDFYCYSQKTTIILIFSIMLDTTLHLKKMFSARNRTYSLFLVVL